MVEHTVKDIDDELLHGICQVFRGWGTVPATGASQVQQPISAAIHESRLIVPHVLRRAP
jgi:hypothetical protein